MDKEKILFILESAKDENGDVPMSLVRLAFEKLPEPCEDTVSRSEVIKALQNDLLWTGSIVEAVKEDSIDLIKKLPSVTPKLPECEDAVSRQAVLYLIADYDLSMGQVVNCIHALPPVTPKPKIGEWKWTSGELNKMNCSIFEKWTCSCCGMRSEFKSNFCPYCGAKMEV